MEKWIARYGMLAFGSGGSVLLGLLSVLLRFNGLYGQDAHEYLRQSRVIFDRLHGLAATPAGIGDVEFAGGYPLAGALLRFVIPDAVLALQVVSWLSAGACMILFFKTLQQLTPGARAKSHWWYAVVLLSAPFFIRAGLTVMSDALGLALALAALWCGMRALEWGRGRDVVLAAVWTALAVSTRFSLAALLLPMVAALVWAFRSRRRLGWLSFAGGTGALAMLPHFWLKANTLQTPLSHSLVQDWSLLNFFRASFSNINGTVDYPWPNVLYILFPLAHPGFCLLLMPLFGLFKKTDLHLFSKKILLACLAAYLLLLGGIPLQNLRYLLPAWVLLLLLLFPAFDRFISYGFYFMRWLAYRILALVLSVQFVFAIKLLQPTLARQRLEVASADALRTVLPPGATLYAFDLDIALRSYLPEAKHYNLWERRYDSFAAGSFILFNETRLRAQWAGKNPMLNWETANQQRQLRPVRELPEGWTLFELE